MSSKTLTIGASFLLLALACSDKEHPPQSDRGLGAASTSADPRLSMVVARIGDTEITAKEVMDHLEQQPDYVRARFKSLDRKKAYLENFVQAELLTQEGRRRGLDRHPDVLRQTKRTMAKQLMFQLRRERVQLDDITEAEIAAHYDQNRNTYRQGERQMSLDEVKGQIRNELFEEKQRKSVQHAIAELRKNAQVTIDEEKLKGVSLRIIEREWQAEGSDAAKTPSESDENR